MRRWLRRLGAVVLAVVVAGFVVLCIAVIDPTTQKPAATDVIVLLGDPYRPGMIDAAGRVAALSPDATVLISTPYQTPCRQRFARQVCFQPDPSTTEGEARYGSSWARSHGARSITVIAPTYQAARARVWFGRCWSGHLAVVAASTPISTRISQIPHQGGGFVKAEIFERRC